MEVDHHLPKSRNAPWIFCHRVNKNICRSVANEFGKFLPRCSAERAGGVGDTLVCVCGRGGCGFVQCGINCRQWTQTFMHSVRVLTTFMCLHIHPALCTLHKVHNMFIYYAGLYVKQSASRSAEGWWSIWRLMDDRIRHSRRGEKPAKIRSEPFWKLCWKYQKYKLQKQAFSITHSCRGLMISMMMMRLKFKGLGYLG